jgi:hypothetical protein
MEEMNIVRKFHDGARPTGAKRRAGGAVMVMVGAGSLVLGLAGAASTAASASGTEGVVATGSLTPADASASSVAAGFYAMPTQGFASASATFVVPTATCTLNGTGQFIGVVDADPASGSPAAGTIAGISVDCNDTTAKYTSEVFIGGNSQTPAAVKPGDTVVASLFQTASTEVATVSDLTSNKTFDTSGSPVPDSAVLIGADSTVPTEKFTKVTFAKVQVNGQYLSMVPRTQYDLLNGAKTLIKASAIASPGDSFSLTVKHAS